ncbi:MAG: glycosyltransferase family 4 protein [Candidatus Omnitrophica bacterium]|nr:glycosyltransferase family 4 protein [Candidatus Omnitrophota bacterium]
MRILMVIPYGTNRSGIEIATVRLAIQLEKMGYFIEIVEKGETHVLNDFPIKGLADILEIEKYLVESCDNYDALHWAGMFETDDEIISQIAVSEKIYFIYHKKVTFFLERTGSSIPFNSSSLYERLVRITSKVSVPNLEQKKQIESILLKPEMVELLPTGVDTEIEFCPIETQTKLSRRQKLGFGDNWTIGIYAGRFVPRKGLDLLLGAWSCISKQNTLLILIGSGFDDPQSTEKQVVNTAKQCGNVAIVPYTDQVDRSYYYALSDFAIFAGRQEGEPTALVESMSCGLPIIASNIPGYDKLVIPKVTGLLFEPENKQELITCINYLINSPDDRRSFGKNARSVAVNNRGIKTIAAKFISLIEQA